MKRIVVELGGHVKVQLRRLRRSTKDAGLAFPCQMVFAGRTRRVVADHRPESGGHGSWLVPGLDSGPWLGMVRLDLPKLSSWVPGARRTPFPKAYFHYKNGYGIFS